MMKKLYALTVALFSLVVTSFGCASIFEWKVQTVTFSSQPPGAQIIINGMSMGVTPATITLKKIDYDNATILFKKEGYQDQQATIQTKITSGLWVNIISGGLLGRLLGLEEYATTYEITGANGKYSPNNYFVTLTPSKTSSGEMHRTKEGVSDLVEN
jgi:hypothetical protein